MHLGMIAASTALLVPAVLLAGGPDVQPASASSPSSDTAAPYPFGPQSFWRSRLDAAPIAADSQAMVDRLTGTVTDRYGGVAAFNAHQYDSPLYTVDAATPTTDFAFTDCQKKGRVPSGLLGPGGQFTGVPVPADAVAATGSDAELSIYSTSTDQLWEFWKASRSTDGTWSACWGGRLDHVSTSAGYFTGGFGATATGLPNAGGLVRLSEIAAGRIDHAISISIPDPATWNRWSWPAQRSDGADTDPAALPEGTRLRLDPSVDVGSLHLTPAGAVVARAAQQYGFIVVDRSGAVSVLAEAVARTGTTDPWRTLLGTPDYAVLKNFPWSRLQAVQQNWGAPTSATSPSTPTSAAGPSTASGGVALTSSSAVPVAAESRPVPASVSAPAPAASGSIGASAVVSTGGTPAPAATAVVSAAAPAGAVSAGAPSSAAPARTPTRAPASSSSSASAATSPTSADRASATSERAAAKRHVTRQRTTKRHVQRHHRAEHRSRRTAHASTRSAARSAPTAKHAAPTRRHR